MPFISIITINKNNAAGLKKTMQSVCAQDFYDFEYIVIDGGSEDGSAEVVGSFKDKVAIFISEQDKGIYDAMNKGITRSKGEYLLFLNSGDCLADTSVLSKMYNDNEGEDLVSGNIIFIENNTTRQDFTPNKLTKFYLLHSMLYHPVTFIKKKLFERFGLYDENFRIVGDYEFFLRILCNTKITYRHLPFNVSLFENNGVSASASTRSKMMDERKVVQRKYFNRVLLAAFNLYKSF